jgi:hypothetical protein
MSTEVQPFRFLDLPMEIRLIVYGQLFAGFVLTIGYCEECAPAPRLRSPAYFEARGWTKPAGGPALPAILATTKLIRTEAEPLFLRSAALDIGGCFGEDLNTVPSHLKNFGTIQFEDYSTFGFRPEDFGRVHTLLIDVGQLSLRKPSIDDDRVVETIIGHISQATQECLDSASSKSNLKIVLYCQLLKQKEDVGPTIPACVRLLRSFLTLHRMTD